MSMHELPPDLFRRWGHSMEEDTGDESVYRPAEYEFPRARGRPGIEFRPDGTFVDWVVGPTDARQAVQGRWEVEAPGRLRLSYEGSARGPEAVEILQASGDVLKVRRTPAGP